jgi:uncharacterized protein
MRFLRILAVLLLVSGATDLARADDTPSPEALKTATELMSVISPDMLDQLNNQMFSAMWPALEQQARAQNMDAATITELHQELEKIVRSYVSDSLKEAPPIYAKHFTVGEMRDMIAFYHTPTGAKALRELPKVMGEFLTQMAPHMEGLRVQTTDTVNRILRAHGYLK